MKEFFNNLLDYLLTAAPFLSAGALGAVIKRVRSGKMSLKRFLEQVVLSAFLAWCLGVSLQHFTKLPNEVIYPIVSLAGLFSDLILDELEEISRNISGYFGKWFNKKA